MPTGAKRKLTEKQFMSQVIQFAALTGWRWYHTHDSRCSDPGFPDLVFVRGAAVVFAELKSETGAVSPAQQQWIDDLVGAGQRVYVWRPSDWEQIDRVLTDRYATEQAV